MKKHALFLSCVLAILLIAPTAARAEATPQPTTGGVSLLFELPEDRAPYTYRLTDGYIPSRVSFRAKEAFSVLPDVALQALRLDWYDAPASYTVSQLNAAGETIAEETIEDRQLARIVSIDAACTRITVTFHAAGSLGGVAAFAAGESLPEGETVWQSAPEQADLLIIVAEPGMEWLQFGGLLPVYAKENGIQAAVIYISDYSKRERAYEALAGLSSAGFSQYPVFGGFTCDNYDSHTIATDGFGWRILTRYLKNEFAALNPKVIVTHSALDSSGAHRLVAECVLRAAAESKGVQKVYTYGAEEGKTPTVLDWNAPLNAYGGQTAAEIAARAYEKHSSRRVFHSAVDAIGAFTLAYTKLGEDEQKNDLFEHIDTATLLSYAPVTPSPAPTPEITATPEAAATPFAAPAPTPLSVPDTEQRTQGQGLLGSMGLSYRPALYALASGLLITALLFALAYRPISTRRGKGDAVCFCLLPLALGLAAGAILAGTKAEAAKPAPSSAVVEQAAAEATPAPTAEPTAALMPEPTTEPTPDAAAAFEENYFRKPGDPAEVIVIDDEHDHWAYRSDDLGIDIERVFTTNDLGKPLVYFVADIHMKNISEFRPGFGAEGHTGRGAIYPWIIARREKAVLWITGDNLINEEKEEKGILIRDGRLFHAANEEDTLAIYPDMSMRLIPKRLTAPMTLLEDGVENAYSFGPTLINNGVINSEIERHRVRPANPRCGIGYIEPGHYIAIVVDGRQKDYSVGMTIREYAELFAEYGCPIAYNLDGGLSAAMIFMGEQLNSHSGNRIGKDNDISYQRKVPDGLMFGYSEQVPSVDDPISNNGNKN